MNDRVVSITLTGRIARKENRLGSDVKTRISYVRTRSFASYTLLLPACVAHRLIKSRCDDVMKSKKFIFHGGKKFAELQ